MSAARSSDDATAADSTPLLSGPRSPEDSRAGSRRSIRRGQSLRDAARYLRRASSRRMMGEPSMLVREAAAQQLEERQSDWGYSRPVVVLDIIWNFVFVAIAASFLVLSWKEIPSMPLRVWIVGYAMQCVLHIFCVLDEYRRRQRRLRRPSSPSRIPAVEQDPSEYVSLAHMNDESTSSVAKYLESANTMFSFVWWIIGFYWVSAGGQALAHDSPQLYWVCIIFLVFDVFFVVFCVALACVIGVAVCCCLPCIIAILYAVSDQEGASKDDIERLPKFKFQTVANAEKVKDGSDLQGSRGGIMIGFGSTGSSLTKQYLSHEDAECCICLSAYEDGVELRELPCRHHFHCSCVDKWLHINATCPLCKYNILKSSIHGEEQV